MASQQEVAGRNHVNRPNQGTKGNVFVTVGTTRFDRLVAATGSPAFQHLLHSLEYSSLCMQHGQSPEPFQPQQSTSNDTSPSPIDLESYSYRPSLRQDMERADLIVSHAGSGSILEALRLKKKLVVVVNDALMDNHQLELGSALHEQGYLICCTVDNLEETLQQKKYDSLAEFPDPDSKLFANFLDAHLGL